MGYPDKIRMSSHGVARPRQELFSLLQRIIDLDHISLHFNAGNPRNVGN